MREIYEKIVIKEPTDVEKIALSEVITNYTVNKINRFISVDTEKRDALNKTLSIESHYFSGDEFVESPTENIIWELIDNKRKPQ